MSVRKEGTGKRNIRLCRQVTAGAAIVLAVTAVFASQGRAEEINPFLGKPTVERAQGATKRRGERPAERLPLPAPPMPVPSYASMQPAPAVSGQQPGAFAQGKQENAPPVAPWRAIGRVGTLITISDGNRTITVPDRTIAEGCLVAWPDVVCGREGSRLAELEREVQEFRKTVAERERALAEKTREAKGSSERLIRLQVILEGGGKDK